LNRLPGRPLRSTNRTPYFLFPVSQDFVTTAKLSKAGGDVTSGKDENGWRSFEKKQSGMDRSMDTGASIGSDSFSVKVKGLRLWR
jgi:hypothetical protein